MVNSEGFNKIWFFFLEDDILGARMSFCICTRFLHFGSYAMHV